MHIVTVSRQLGSLGDVIATVMAREMGYKLIGPDQVHERAHSCDPEFKDACTLYETEKGPGFWDRFFFDTPSYTALFKSLTYEFASQGNVVIIGRGAQLVLKDVSGMFSLRIVAPTATRVARIAERFGVSRERAAQMVRRHDRERRSLMQSIFDQDMRDWALYDLVLNTEHYGADGAAEVAIKAAQNMLVEPEPEDSLARLAAMALAKRVEMVIKKRLTPAVAGKIEVEGEPGGLIRLTGFVKQESQKTKAGDIAREYPGVTQVENKVKAMHLPFGY